MAGSREPDVQSRGSAGTRDKLLEVAETGFARRGYEGAHLQAIAEELGVQKTALYYYFPSKGALYLAVLSRMIEDFDRCVAGALDPEAPHRDRLQRLVDEVNELLAKRRNYSQILIRIFVDHADVDLGSLTPALERLVGRVLRFYREGVDAGDFRALSSRHFFMSLLGMSVFHYAARNLSASVLGLEDVFTENAVAWRRSEVTRMLGRGVLAQADDPDPGPD